MYAGHVLHIVLCEPIDGPQELLGGPSMNSNVFTRQKIALYVHTVEPCTDYTHVYVQVNVPVHTP